MKRSLLALATCGALLGCGRRAELGACNIAKRSCQEDIYYEIVRLRGDGWDPFQGVPPIRTITLAAYRDELIAAQPPATQPTTPTAPPKADPREVALHLLGLVTPTTSTTEASIDDRVNNVAAFYDSATGEVTVIDRGDVHNDAADTTLLAHELVHAFQRNEQGAGGGSTTTDGYFAAQALVEGEAVLYEHFVSAELQGVAPQQVDWTRYYKSWTQGLRNQMTEWEGYKNWTPALRASQAKSPYYAVSWFVYPFGANLLTRAWLAGGNSAVRRLGTDFPRHAFDYMASMADVTDAAPATLPCQVDPPGKAFQQAIFDRFGAMQVYAFLGAQGLEEGTAWTQALHWRDDLIWVYFEEESQTVAVTWRIRFGSRSAADAAVAAVSSPAPSLEWPSGDAALGSTDRAVDPNVADFAITKRLPALKATRQGNDAVIVGSNRADLLASWPGAAKCKASL